MGMLDTFFTAGITASMVSNSVNSKIGNDNTYTEKSIILSHEKSYLGRLCIDEIRKENFENNNENILQITKESVGVNEDNCPLYFMEYISGKNYDIEGITIHPNDNCFQKQFKNSKFCALTFNEMEDFIKEDENYKLVKIYTEPITISKGLFDANEKLYLCEVIITNSNNKISIS